MPLDQGLARKLRRDREFMQKKQTERTDMEKRLFYAGIGSRKTPDYILDLMQALAVKLRHDGLWLRTGHATGADQAFEDGAQHMAQIFLPWRTFEQDHTFYATREENGEISWPEIFNDPVEEAFALAMKYHPNWGALSQGSQKLQARNSHQILGPKPQSRPTPVEFVICWTEDGLDSGGTGQALRIALDYDIDIFNLYDEETYDMAFEWAWSEE